MTEILGVEEAGAFDRAASLLLAGQLVAVPTETVYGLAADATDGEAVARIYAAKGRPSFNPLIVHAADQGMAERIAVFDELADRLAAAFWPGPLTMVLPLRPDSGIASLVTASLSTVALRVPAAPTMQALIARIGRPLAAPSANASGRISPTMASHVADSLGGRVPLVLDGGPATHGLESSIVRPVGDAIELLRPGPVTTKILAEVSGLQVRRPIGGHVTAPGQLSAHYAPTKPLRLDAQEAAADEWLIGFGLTAGDATLSASGSLLEAAATLFARLHEADRAPQPRIAVAPIPPGGLGDAIRDRLIRAATGSGGRG